MDFGTYRTSGAMAGGSGVTTLEIEGARWLSSTVVAGDGGLILVGAAAENQAGVHPDRVERTPKRHLGSGAPLILGSETVEVAEAVAALLAMFLEEGSLRNERRPPALAVLTNPVRWGDARRRALMRAAEIAGYPETHLIEEPVAAAVHYVTDQVAVGEHVGVYDLGGGTFDTAVLKRTESGFETVGAPGGDEYIGGEHFDHKLFSYFGGCLAEEDPETWNKILTSDERRWRQAAVDLLSHARRAKEALSSYPSTKIFVPEADREIVVTREQFESMILDEIERTIDEMEDTIATAGLTGEDMSALYLVGGSSRIPIVVRLLTARFGSCVTTRDEPKSVVALGAASLARRWMDSGEVDTSSDPVAPAQPEAREVKTAVPGVPALAVDESQADAPVIMWETTPPSWLGPMASDGSNLWSHLADGTVVCLDVGNGDPAWTSSVGPANDCAPSSDGGVVLVSAADGAITALNPTTGAAFWRVDLGQQPTTSVVTIGEILVVGTSEGSAIALRRADGGAKWRLPFGSAVRAAVASGSSAYLSCANGRLYDVDGRSGEVRWMYPTGGDLVGLPSIERTFIHVPSGDGKVYTLERASGSPVWAYQTTGPVMSCVSDANLVIAASVDDRLHAMKRDTGEPLWHLSVGPWIGPPVLSRGRLFVIGADSRLRCIDLTSSRLRWTLDISLSEGSRVPPPITANGLLAVATGDGRLLGLW
ncbi:MAG: Chaperone protein DnaK [Acidimicrobiales bacterium]|nr:MAG: hypothetical protein EDR02_14070 [Actinomycetota bacterium]MBV6509293.1 Chaperone protein DnaK [Acidimicrobiales bacterium]RIK03982.1 MAG: hypothetical protein DCC48_14850 [Acidobacteriota bacterium]